MHFTSAIRKCNQMALEETGYQVRSCVCGGGRDKCGVEVVYKAEKKNLEKFFVCMFNILLLHSFQLLSVSPRQKVAKPHGLFSILFFLFAFLVCFQFLISLVQTCFHNSVNIQPGYIYFRVCIAVFDTFRVIQQLKIQTFVISQIVRGFYM